MGFKVRDVLNFLVHRYKTFAHQNQLILLALCFASSVGYFSTHRYRYPTKLYFQKGLSSKWVSDF